MPFKTKTDPYGLAAGVIEIEDVDENKSAQMRPRYDASGAMVASTIFGETIAPGATYKITADGVLAIILGTVSTYATKKVMLGNVTINTGAGAEPTVTASGEQVEDDAATDHKFDAGSVTLEKSHHAQILFEAFTLTGGDLSTANYNIQAKIGTTTVGGVIKASDITDGKIEASITISPSGDTVPVLTAGSADWVIVEPLSEKNPGTDYASYTAKLLKKLAHTTTP